MISILLFTWFLSIIGFLVVLFNYFFFIFFFVSIPADSNRVPYDLPEAESEPVAGFITEYSTIYFSIILLTEYANIIALTYLIILVFSIYPLPLVFILYFICLIRSTLNRLKFDELMISARLVILPIIFSFLLLSFTILFLYYIKCYWNYRLYRKWIIELCSLLIESIILYSMFLVQIHEFYWLLESHCILFFMVYLIDYFFIFYLSSTLSYDSNILILPLFFL